jgi:hypothetical protein
MTSLYRIGTDPLHCSLSFVSSSLFFFFSFFLPHHLNVTQVLEVLFLHQTRQFDFVQIGHHVSIVVCAARNGVACPKGGRGGVPDVSFAMRNVRLSKFNRHRSN